MSRESKKRPLIRWFVAASPLFLVSSANLEARAQAATVAHSNQAGERYFTVRDSIEMARFGRLDFEPIFSPDGKHLAVVTSRGGVDTNQVESTVWVFTTDSIRQALGQNRDASPMIVARLAMTPTVEAFVAYHSVIEGLRWTTDSRHLLFLGQNSRGNRQLYKAGLRENSARVLTPADQDVGQFDSAGETIVYRVMDFRDKQEAGERINPDALDVTGLPIASILFPASRFESRYSTLWLNQNNKNRPLVDKETGNTIQIWNEPPLIWSPLSVSPDEKSVVVLEPVKGVLPSWKQYQSKYIPADTIEVQDASRTSDLPDSKPGRRLTQYAVINLDTGKIQRLVDAPNGYALGYNDRNRAAWSPDGKKILLINTFLPLEGVNDSEKEGRRRACAAAVVDLESKVSHCVSFGHTAHVWGSYFGKTWDDVLLRFDEHMPEERFHFQGDRWQLLAPGEETHPAMPSRCTGPRENLSDGLLVYVQQSLNDPPVLSATDCATSRQKTIWNPNPQLANMKLGEASTIKWKDASGYEWTGALIKPPNYVPGQRYPLVIHTYGYVDGEFLTDGEDTTAYAARPMAAAGMVVLVSFPTRPEHALTPQEAQDQIVGFDSAIDRFVSDGLVDRDKVGIIGFSRFCYIVESAIIEHPKRFAAATIADGVGESYLPSLFFSAVGKEGEAIYGAKPFGPGLKKWIDESPGFNLHKVETPLRIEANSPSSVLMEWEYYAALWQQKKPVDFIYIPDGQHILQKPLDRMASQQGNVDWFRFWLKGEEDPDPTKAKQYGRWRELRKLQEVK